MVPHSPYDWHHGCSAELVVAFFPEVRHCLVFGLRVVWTPCWLNSPGHGTSIADWEDIIPLLIELWIKLSAMSRAKLAERGSQSINADIFRPVRSTMKLNWRFLIYRPGRRRHENDLECHLAITLTKDYSYYTVYNSVFKRHLHRHDVMEVRRIFDAGNPNGPWRKCIHVETRSHRTRPMETWSSQITSFLDAVMQWTWIWPHL